MTNRISRLKINGFRGATQPLDLVFDENKPIVLIFGENGSGKSTIVDAMESVGAGTTAFLNNWKLGQGKRKECYIPAFGKELADVAISMDFGSHTYSAILSNRGIRLCDTKDRPITKVLRRKSLQAFMDADPAQRYKELATFLDIPQIEVAEASLREALKNTQKRHEMATFAYSQAKESLHNLWEAEGSPGLEDNYDAESWSRQQSVIPTEQLQKDLAKLKASVKYRENLNTETEALVSAKNQLAQAKAILAEKEEQLSAIEAIEGTGSAELLTLLLDARTYLSKSPDTLCPVCEKTAIDSAELVQRLGQRIVGMESLKQAGVEKSDANRSVHTYQDHFNQAMENLLGAAQIAQRNIYPDMPEAESIKQLQLIDKDKALLQARETQESLADSIEPLRSNIEDMQKQLNNLASIRQSVKILDEKLVETKYWEARSKCLQEAVDIFEAKRKSYVEGVLGSIATDVDNLYQQIHPQENIGQIKLKLDDNKRGSLVYGVAFGGKQDIQPQPYYSESHLDTLGLCIFLALAKRGDSSRILIVLDDVLGSVDQLHLQRILDMLTAQADSFAQMVITTHYRPLRDRFRFAQQESAKVQLIELKHWNFTQGIISSKTLGYAKDLCIQLQAPEFRRESMTAQAGILFEQLLEFISQTYRCKAPHLIEPRYTFGELAHAPDRKLKQVLKIIRQTNNENVEIPLKPIYDSLQSAIQIRNLVGCHFNQWAGELSDDEVKKMMKLALKLANTLICPDCGSLPTSNKSGSYWQCKCKQTRMYPFQQPQQ